MAAIGECKTSWPDVSLQTLSFALLLAGESIYPE